MDASIGRVMGMRRRRLRAPASRRIPRRTLPSCVESNAASSRPVSVWKKRSPAREPRTVPGRRPFDAIQPAHLQSAGVVAGKGKNPCPEAHFENRLRLVVGCASSLSDADPKVVCRVAIELDKVHEVLRGWLETATVGFGTRRRGGK